MPETTSRRPNFLATIETGKVHAAAFGRNGAPRNGTTAFGGNAQPPTPEAPTPEEIAAIRREAMERVTEAVSMLRLQAQNLADQARADVIEIAVQIARRILETEIQTNPEALFSLVRSALKKVGDSRRIVVKLSPDDAILAASDKTRLAADALTAARIEVATDPTLGRGDVLVETDFGKVDGRLQTRLGESRRAVQAAIEGDAA